MSRVKLIVLLLAFTGCSRPEQHAVIRVGVLQHASAAPIVEALENGTFARHGLDVQLKTVTPAEHMPALLRGEVDVLSASSFPVILSAAQQNPGAFYCYMTGGESTEGDTIYGLVVRKDDPASELKDLVGATIGSASKFTTVNLRNVLRTKFGDSADKTQIRELGQVQLLVQALARKELRAAVVDQPSLAAALANGDLKLIDRNFRARYLSNPYWSGAGLVSAKWLSAGNTEAFGRFLDALDAELKQSQSAPQVTKQVFAHHFNLTVPSDAIGLYVYPSARFSPPPAFLADIGLLLKNSGILQTEFNAQALFQIPGLR